MKKLKSNSRHRQQKKMKKEARRKKIRAAKRKNYLALVDRMRNMDEDELKEFLGDDYEPEEEIYEEQVPGYDT
tara:strand:- start:265 stop:483 length:219 start_codon:yes stop_codon:yes gene_type:complete